MSIDPHFPGSDDFYLSRTAPVPRRGWEKRAWPAANADGAAWGSEDARWAEIEAARVAGTPRQVFRPRVGMPRGGVTARRRGWLSSLLVAACRWLFSGKRAGDNAV